MRRTGFSMTRGGAAALLLLAATGAQSSVILSAAPNGVTLFTSLTVGYDGTGSTAADAGSDTAGATADPTGFDVVTTARSAAAVTPAASGEPKDEVSADLRAAFEYAPPFPGASIAVDTFTFSVGGTASAVDAHNAAGNPADAVVVGTARAAFFLDAGFAGVAPDTAVGTLNVGALRALELYETLLALTVFEDGVAMLARGPGGGPGAISARAGHGYELVLDYAMRVPFGADPPFTLELPTTLDPPLPPPPPPKPAPEPGTLLLAALGVACLARRTVPRRCPG